MGVSPVLSIRVRLDMRLTEKEVLRAIHGLEKPASQQAIADSLDCARATVQRAIRRLKDKGVLETVGDTNPATYRINRDCLPEELRKELS